MAHIAKHGMSQARSLSQVKQDNLGHQFNKIQAALKSFAQTLTTRLVVVTICPKSLPPMLTRR